MEEKSSVLRPDLLLKITITTFGIYYTVLYFFLSIPRLIFPYEIEWFEGMVLDHALRIFQGKQLFVSPTIKIVNLQYQPSIYLCRHRYDAYLRHNISCRKVCLFLVCNHLCSANRRSSPKRDTFMVVCFRRGFTVFCSIRFNGILVRTCAG